MSIETTSEAFFEAKYERESDPWHFASSSYERSRYAITLSCLDGRHFQRAFEPGCSIGVLTEQLAKVCEQVEAIEISATAAAQAMERCKHLSNVNVRHAALPSGIPEGTFDLVLFSEMGYYFDPKQLSSLGTDLVARLVPSGIFLAVHWLGKSRDHLLSGDQVHEILGGLPGLQSSLSRHYEGFRLDRWTKL